MDEEKSENAAPEERFRWVQVTPYYRQVEKHGSKFWLILGIFYASYLVPLTIKMFMGTYNKYGEYSFGLLLGLCSLYFGWKNYSKTHMEIEECGADDEGAFAGVVKKDVFIDMEENKVKIGFLDKFFGFVFLLIPVFFYIRSVIYADEYFGGVVYITIVVFMIYLVLCPFLPF